jgi:hypothetical protein
MWGVEFEFKINGKTFPVNTDTQIDAFIAEITTLRRFLRPIPANRKTSVQKPEPDKRDDQKASNPRGFLSRNPQYPNRTLDHMSAALLTFGNAMTPTEIEKSLHNGGHTGVKASTIRGVPNKKSSARYFDRYADGRIGLTHEGREHGRRVLATRGLHPPLTGMEEFGEPSV